MSTSADFDRCVLDFMADDPLTVYYHSNTATYSDTTGENTITTLSIPCQAIFLDMPKYSAGDGTREGSLIREGDKLLFVRPPEKTDPYRNPLIIDPVADRILVGTTSYKIVTSKQTNPSAANCLLYEFYIRK